MYIYKQPNVHTYMYVYMTGHIALSWGGIVEEEDITPMYIHIHLYVYVYTQVYILICIYTCKPIIYIFVYMTGHLGFSWQGIVEEEDITLLDVAAGTGERER